MRERRHDPGWPSWRTGPASSGTWPPIWPANCRRTPPMSTPTRLGWRRCSERRAVLTGLTRKYGADRDVDEVLGLGDAVRGSAGRAGR